MAKKYSHDLAHTSDTRLSPESCRETPLATVLRRLRQSLYHGQFGDTLDDVTGIEGFDEILRYIRDAQEQLSDLARGNSGKPVPLEGHTGELLKELQGNLRHVIRKARRLTVGDFACEAGCMGEVSEAFEVMGRTLQAALVRLEQQKQDLTDLSESLRREIDARAVVEKDLRREQARLQKLASTDPLTGIANRRQFFQTAIRELERIRRTKSHACLAMLDIDHFKALNDTLGHGAGDKALRRIAKIITSSIRLYDLVGRYGGDEFIFLFPEIVREDAYALLERLRDSVEKSKISAGKNNPNITVSIGLTELIVDKAVTSGTLDQAIKRADDALYKAKNSSRNHVYII